MNSTLAIIIVLVVIVAVIILIAALVARGKKKKISFTDSEDTKAIDKSGNYQASNQMGAANFNFGTPKKEKDLLPGQELDQARERVDEAILDADQKISSAADKINEAIDAAVLPHAEELKHKVEDRVEKLEEKLAADVVETVSDIKEKVEEKRAEADLRAKEIKAEVKDAVEPVIDDAVETVQERVKEEEKEVAETAPEPEPEPVPEVEREVPEAAVGRLGRLRGRLSRSSNAFSQGLLGVLSAGDLDEDAWEEIEDTLLMADLGTKQTMKIVEDLREKVASEGVENEAQARAMLKSVLMANCAPESDRAINVSGNPGVVLVVGVNGTGKTTTTGKLARVLVSMGHSVVLGAADTFRAAAADQLQMWGDRVGATTVRGPEGADPASVAFDAVSKGIEQKADVVLIDTAGRLHTSVDLMDQLGKVKRVVEKRTKVDEVILVLDATIGQNGLMQARTFSEVVDITGVALTKLDGSAKGGIVFQVQEELGVPVKLVGLGEGPDDLAPFEVEAFIDALLG